MNIYLSLDDLPKLPTPRALTIGMFDGVHQGHHLILSNLKKNSEHAAVLTFTNHPCQVLSNQPAPLLLTDPMVKYSLFQMHGIDTLISIPFTKQLADLSYDAFLSLLLTKMSLSHLVLGEGEGFGKNREGIPEKVTHFAKERGIATHFIPKLLSEGKIISSSHIRTLIAAGNFSTAEKLLGKPYLLSIDANKKRIDGSHLCLPPDGTYLFFSQTGEPSSIQIKTDTKGRWILLPKAYPVPTLIASALMKEFY